MRNLYLMCGPAGAGKSTWLKENMPDATVISRDKIRFALLKDGDDYFAYEDTVLKIFEAETQNAINNDKIETIVLDATHLTPKARRAALKNLKNLDKVVLGAISMETDLETCLTQNAKRTGRALVPKTVIKNMYECFVIPTEKEGFVNIIHVRKENENE